MEEKSLRKYSIVGFPDDLGIKAVGGRMGAAAGPHSFMEAFKKLSGAPDCQSRMREAAVVVMGSDLEQNHARGAREVTRISQAGDIVIAIGGGHDYAYPWIKGLKAAGPKKNIGCINIDAHFDLRAYSNGMTSGSPFRRLLDEKWIKPQNLIEFGIQAHCNSEELWKFAKKSKIKVVPYEQLRPGKGAVSQFKKILTSLKKRCSDVVISLDLDALSFAFAPGVSAPQAEGFTASEIFEMLEIAGSDKKVTSLGIFELSPPNDVQNYTSRLAAQATWHFLSKKLSKK